MRSFLFHPELFLLALLVLFLQDELLGLPLQFFNAEDLIILLIVLKIFESQHSRLNGRRLARACDHVTVGEFFEGVDDLGGLVLDDDEEH